jgi:hypothetical protein
VGSPTPIGRDTRVATATDVADRTKPRVRPRQPKLLSGGNPQIPKGHGDAPVRAWLAALPGWKKAAARQLDAVVTRAVPGVSKAVKYNSPLYGIDGRTWFLSLHAFDRYIKVTFFRGTQLDPVPPIASKMAHVRYFHFHETDSLPEARFATWVKQASALPGEKL